MSVLIKNMEMPTDDSIQITLYLNGRVVKANAVEYEEFEAIPVPSHGRWIKKDYWSEGVGMGESYGYYYKCSECGRRVQGDYNECGYNFCPNCGSRMDLDGDAE